MLRKDRSALDHVSLESISRLTNRFWARVDRGSPDSCWLWEGPKTGSQAYGAFCFDSKYVYAHRFAYILHHGEIPDGHVVMHTCDTPHCVNPAHLKSGTQQDNILDSVRKGRWLTEARWESLERQEREPDGRYKAKLNSHHWFKE